MSKTRLSPLNNQNYTSNTLRKSSEKMQDIESVEKKLAQLIENAIKTTRSFTNSNYSPRGAMVMNLRKK